MTLQQFRRPESVLIVIHTEGGEFLLLERRRPPGFWQSVTGSMEWGEPADAAARREVIEETGISQGVLVNLQWTQVYEILPAFGKVYAPGVTQNLEHAFSLRLQRSRAGSFKRRGACAVPLGVGRRCHGNGVFQHESCGHCRTALVGPDAMSTLVVYVHGLWLTGNEGGILLRRLGRELNAKTRAFSYPSVRSNISDSAQALGKFLAQQRAETLHLVGHSLGGLVILKLFESGAGAQLPPGTNRVLRFAAERQPRGAESSASAVRQENLGKGCTRGIAHAASTPLDGPARTGRDRRQRGNRLGKAGGHTRRTQRWHDLRGRDAAAGHIAAPGFEDQSHGAAVFLDGRAANRCVLERRKFPSLALFVAIQAF